MTPLGRVEIRPEPSPDERAALEAALAELAEERQPLSAWWQAGVDGAADDEEAFPKRVWWNGARRQGAPGVAMQGRREPAYQQYVGD